MSCFSQSHHHHHHPSKSLLSITLFALHYYFASEKFNDKTRFWRNSQENAVTTVEKGNVSGCIQSHRHFSFSHENESFWVIKSSQGNIKKTIWALFANLPPLSEGSESCFIFTTSFESPRNCMSGKEVIYCTISWDLLANETSQAVKTSSFIAKQTKIRHQIWAAIKLFASLNANSKTHNISFRLRKRLSQRHIKQYERIEWEGGAKMKEGGKTVGRFKNKRS